MPNTLNFDNISVLIYHKRDSDNDENWSWVKKRYEALMPNVEINFGDALDDNYNKSTTINNAAKNATRDIFIIADSNLVFNIECIEKSLEMLNHYPFVMPFDKLIYIGSKETIKLRQLSPSSYINKGFFTAFKNDRDTQNPIFILPRSHFESIGGFDENATDWNEENTDFAMRLYSKLGDYAVIKQYPVWSLFYKKIHHPFVMDGINVDKICKPRYCLNGISWDVRL